MKENTQFLLDKAESSIGAAESLLRDGYRDFAAGRAYYAMFYTAEALLAEKELGFKKHVGVHRVFSEHFIKTGVFEHKYYHGLSRYSTAAWLEIMQFEPNLRMMKCMSGLARHVNS